MAGELADRLRRQLDVLNRAGTWSVTVSGNWRVTFTFEGEDAFDVDLEDYH